MSQTIEPETIEHILKSLEGQTVQAGDAKDLIWRVAKAVDRDLDGLHERIIELERLLGL